ncbi:MAG: PLP-dependent transferase [Fimbriimonadaceae bacterium]|nr:PLP-dependent transferase [Fimbriimonadaceae bacterium]
MRDLANARLDTLLQHVAEEDRTLGAVVPPIFQTSLFVFDKPEDMRTTMFERPGGPPFHYSRVGNPTNDILERKIALLEKAEACKAFSSGMAAISAAIFHACRAGSHAVMIDTAYPPSRMFLNTLAQRYGVSHTYVDGRTVESILDAVRPETTLIYLESPSSFLFRLQDLRAVAAFARERGITTVIDNTYASPLYQNPIEMGIDIVCHSASKYLNGHSDVVAGVLCTSRERMEAIVREEVALLGAALPPFPAWLMLRGLRTLRLRVKQHEATANEVAAWLERQPWVQNVNHVGLPSHPQRALVESQMRGSTGLFSFEPTFQTQEANDAFVGALRLFRCGVSWGGHESLAVPLFVTPLDRPEGFRLVRLYCGLEDPADLIEDLDQASRAVGHG